MEIAPGSILQRMYLKRRIRKISPKSFCEIGSGNGYISNLLLKEGLKGKAFDLNSAACENNKLLNNNYIKAGLFSVYNVNILSESLSEKFDLIISSMVIEHLDEDTVNSYFNTCISMLNHGGQIVVLVPASMKYWGIEDEIAGHFKRYEYDDFTTIATRHQLKINNLAGLTYPVSNWLFSISNYLVKKSESYKKNMTMNEQTVLSGNRNVKFKTSYPIYMRLFLNEYTLFPFYLMQSINLKNKNAMIIYCEFNKS